MDLYKDASVSTHNLLSVKEKMALAPTFVNKTERSSFLNALVQGKTSYNGSTPAQPKNTMLRAMKRVLSSSSEIQKPRKLNY